MHEYEILVTRKSYLYLQIEAETLDYAIMKAQNMIDNDYIDCTDSKDDDWVIEE